MDALYITVGSFVAFVYSMFLSLSCVAHPSTTAPPTEVSTTNIPVCCAGVQLNLANPDDLSLQVQVLVDGTPHPLNQFNRSGSFLYITGLQAGTKYSLNITMSNMFGTVWVYTTVRPLLGELVLIFSHVSGSICGINICSHQLQDPGRRMSKRYVNPPFLPQAVPPPHKWPSPLLLVD